MLCALRPEIRPPHNLFRGNISLSIMATFKPRLQPLSQQQIQRALNQSQLDQIFPLIKLIFHTYISINPSFN